MISPELLAEYDTSRAAGTDRSVLCHAPFVSLNFDQSGKVTACCFNRHYVLGTYPEQDVRDIWTGEPAKALREAFLTGSNASGCDRCFDQLRNRNFSGALMRNFDRYTAGRVTNLVRHGQGAARAAGSDGPPLVLEFEISNTCTLECVMCGGHWSSTIRAKREKLPPIHNPYDRRFVDQIEEFIPTIVAARFLGGEPFLITRYYEIWDSIRRLNPSAEISITTSGAVLPDRPKAMLEELRANIIVSLDGITAPTYESIRVNARFDQVMENIRFFRDYTRRRNTAMTAAVCPMTHNWHELQQIVDFCEERGITLYFNTVTFPVESSLAGLPEARLGEVIDRLEGQGQARSQAWTAGTRAQWQSFVNQLHGWMDEKRSFLRHCSARADAVRSFAGASLGATDAASPLGGLDALIEPLMIASEVERERARAKIGAGTLDGALLPQTPLALWAGDEGPGARDLLRGAHVIRRFLDADDSDQKGNPDGGGRSVVDEHLQLRSTLDRALDTADLRAGFDRLGAWIRDRLRNADVRAVFGIIEQTLESLDIGRAMLLADPAELRRRFDEGCESLQARGLSDSDRPRMRVHFNRLVAVYSLPSLFDSMERAGGEVVIIRRISDVHDLRLALYAAELFHRCFGRPAEHSAFCARLDMIRELLTPERADAIIKRLQQSDVSQIYTFMSTVSDAEFAGAIGAVAQ